MAKRARQGSAPVSPLVMGIGILVVAIGSLTATYLVDLGIYAIYKIVAREFHWPVPSFWLFFCLLYLLGVGSEMFRRKRVSTAKEDATKPPSGLS